jgi:hypothetical protein
MGHNVIRIPPESEVEMLQRQYARAAAEGNLTRNGVVYRWWLEGAHGAGFKLFREPHHTGDDMQQAEDQLRASRDVAELYIVTIDATARVEPEPYIVEISPAR